jgi:hypothetical protein
MRAAAVVNPTRPARGLTARNGILDDGPSLCLACAVEALAEVHDQSNHRYCSMRLKASQASIRPERRE